MGKRTKRVHHRAAKRTVPRVERGATGDGSSAGGDSEDSETSGNVPLNPYATVPCPKAVRHLVLQLVSFVAADAASEVSSSPQHGPLESTNLEAVTGDGAASTPALTLSPIVETSAGGVARPRVRSHPLTPGQLPVGMVAHSPLHSRPSLSPRSTHSAVSAPLSPIRVSTARSRDGCTTVVSPSRLADGVGHSTSARMLLPPHAAVPGTSLEPQLPAWELSMPADGRGLSQAHRKVRVTSKHTNVVDEFFAIRLKQLERVQNNDRRYCIVVGCVRRPSTSHTTRCNSCCSSKDAGTKNWPRMSPRLAQGLASNCLCFEKQSGVTTEQALRTGATQYIGGA